MGIPVVIAEYGLGMPVRPVETGAPLMTIAENGLGAPIVLSEGGTPFVLEGLAPDYDPDALAFFARNGQEPTDEQKAIYNYFVVQAKAFSDPISGNRIWDYIVDVGFMGAQDPVTARIGLKNVIDLTDVGAGPAHYPGFGMQGNGVDQALDTGYVFPPEMQNDASIGVYCLNRAQSDASLMGNGNCVISPRHLSSADTFFARVNAASAGTVGNSVDPIGFLFVNRTGPLGADGSCWKHGAEIISSQGASETPDAVRTLWILGRNFTSLEYSARPAAFWHVGRGMPDSLIPIYDQLVDDVCAMLAASVTVVDSMTLESKSLLRYMIKMGRRPDYLLGAFDNTYWPLGTTPNLIDDIATMTGEAPAIVSMEWVDPLGSEGSVGSAAQLARIKAHYAAGGIVSLHHHPGNPVTGEFYQTPSAQDPPTPGNQYDKSGSPVVNCLTGGSVRSDFLAYVDRIINFVSACVGDDGKKIPIIVRWWHEIDGNWFWWNDASTPANSQQLFRDFVDRMVAAGIDNVIFDFNRTIIATPSTAFYPGNDYCDLVSGDYYDNAASSVGGLSEAQSTFAALRNSGALKPQWIAEIGYQVAGGTDATIWDVKTGFYHRDRFGLSAGFVIWRSPYGPAVGDASVASFQTMVAESHCITRDLAEAYTFTQALPGAPPPEVSLIGSPVTSGEVGVAYAGFTVTAEYGVPPYTYSLVGAWPAGITINPSTGQVSGEPTEFGTFPDLNVQVTDSEMNTAQLASAFTLTILRENLLRDLPWIAGSNTVMTDMGNGRIRVARAGANPKAYKVPTLIPGATYHLYGNVYINPAFGSFSYRVAETEAFNSGLSYTGPILNANTLVDTTFVALNVSAWLSGVFLFTGTLDGRYLEIDKDFRLELVSLPFSPLSVAQVEAWWTAKAFSGSNWIDERAGHALAMTGATYNPGGWPGSNADCVSFDGVDDFGALNTPAFVPTGAEPGFVLLVVNQKRLASDTGHNTIFGYGDSGATSRSLGRRVTSGVNRAKADTGDGLTGVERPSSTADFSGAHVLLVEHTGTQVNFSVDGGAVQSSAVVPSTVANRIHIGAAPHSPPGAFANVDIRDAIIGNGMLGGTERDALIAWAMARVGLT